MNRHRNIALVVLWTWLSLTLSEDARVAAASGPSATPAKVTASYGGEAGYQAPIWIAHELKLFIKYGISSELVRIAGGTLSIATLLSNSSQVSQSASVAPLQGALAGGDLVIIATSTNRATVSIIAQPKSVKRPQDLAGKTVALVGRGDMNEFFFLNALKKWGVNPKTITLLTIPGSQPRLTAVATGTIDATLVSVPFSFEAERLNLITLADFATSPEPFPQSTLVVRREFLYSHRGIIKRFLMAYAEAIHAIKAESEKALPIMKKYMRISDDQIAKRSYDYYSKLFSQPPLTEERAIALVLEFLSSQPGFANARAAKAANFFDNSLLVELQMEGFFARLK